jgi:methylated-DNA-[protein]-cysteine S-methyltransferase
MSAVTPTKACADVVTTRWANHLKQTAPVAPLRADRRGSLRLRKEHRATRLRKRIALTPVVRHLGFMPETTIDTPTGPMVLTETDGAITRAEWGSGPMDDTPLLRKAAQQIAEYFTGQREDFDLPLRVEASEFQQKVCDAMSAIPFGDTRTYGDIAKDLGVPAQAIGQACGGNPIPVIIPCHRVLGASGLGGFSGRGGVETKVWLLKHEGAAGLLI